MSKNRTPSLKAKTETKYLVIKRFRVTVNDPQIRGAGHPIDFFPGRIVTSSFLGADLLKYAYYSGHITDDFKINEAGHVVHPEDKTEKKTAVWRKHFK